MDTPNDFDHEDHFSIGDLSPYPDALPPLSDAEMLAVSRQAGIHFQPGSIEFVLCPGERDHTGPTTSTDCRITNEGTRPFLVCSQGGCSGACAAKNALMEWIIREGIRLDKLASREGEESTDRWIEKQRTKGRRGSLNERPEK